MPTATIGSPQTINLGAADALIVSCSAVDAVASVAGSTGFIGAPYELGRVVGETGRKFGPYGRAVSLIVSSLSGAITAEVSQPSRVGDGADALSTQQGSAAQGVVSGAWFPTGLDALRNGAVIPHRGGGGTIRPEDSLEGMRSAYNAWFRTAELDVRTVADGSTIMMHDSTLDRTTTGTGAVTAVADRAAVRALVHDPANYLAAAGFDAMAVPTWDDVLAEFANRTVLMPEPKDNATNGNATAAGLARHGVRTDMAIVGTFDPTWTAAARAMGYPILQYAADVTSMDFTTRQALGVRAISARDGWTAERVAACRAAGLIPGIWTINRRAEADAFLALGGEFVISDEPDYVRGGGLQRRGNQFTGGFWPHGLIPYGGSTATEFARNRGRVQANGQWQITYLDTSTPSVPLLGFLGKTTGSWQLDFRARWDTSGGANSSITLFVNCPTDVVQRDAAGTYQPGYCLRFRRNQNHQIFRVDGLSTLTLLAEKAAGAALAGTGTGASTTGDQAAAAGTGTPYDLRVTYDASTGILRLWNITTDGAVTPSVVAPADFAFTGGFIHAGRGISSTVTFDNGFTLA